mmetsp:Transcript_28524/g.28847  ORF Transcript_28524/g.28847 Transcript_28524/m.28847 type:complete len:223 (+) Transcript_28524:148-816(+)
MTNQLKSLLLITLTIFSFVKSSNLRGKAQEDQRSLQDFNVYKSYHKSGVKPRQYGRKTQTQHDISEYLSPMQQRMMSKRRGKDSPEDMVKHNWSGFTKNSNKRTLIQEDDGMNDDWEPPLTEQVDDDYEWILVSDPDDDAGDDDFYYYGDDDEYDDLTDDNDWWQGDDEEYTDDVTDDYYADDVVMDDADDADDWFGYDDGDDADADDGDADDDNVGDDVDE